MVKILLFDWGNTVMVDFGFPGPMYTWPRVSWVDGAENALAAVSKRYACCLATNAGASTTPEVLMALKRVGAEKYFRKIFLAKEIGFRKPDKKFFQSIMDHFSLPANSLVMIGDHYLNDIVGAKNAGLRTVFFNTRHLPDPFPLADAVIESLNDLERLIDGL